MFKSFTAPGSGRLVASLRTDPSTPAPVRQAVRLMYTGAAASAVSLILSVIASFSLKNELISANAQNLKDHKVTMSQIDSVATAGVVYAIVVGALAVALWIWMAKMSAGGRNWARISSTVFFALWSLYTYLNISALKGGVSVTASLIVSLVLLLAIWVIGAAAIYFLWRPVSTAYFKAQANSR